MHYLFLLFLLFSPPTLWAHSVGGHVIDTQQAVVLEFRYSTNDPARYANIKVYSPDDSNIEYQNARTDKQGRFAFIPTMEGPWTVVMSDTMGHKTQVVIQNSQPDTNTQAEPSTLVMTTPTHSLLFSSILGVSLILNIFIGLYVFIKNKKQRRTHAY